MTISPPAQIAARTVLQRHPPDHVVHAVNNVQVSCHGVLAQSTRLIELGLRAFAAFSFDISFIASIQFAGKVQIPLRKQNRLEAHHSLALRHCINVNTSGRSAFCTYRHITLSRSVYPTAAAALHQHLTSKRRLI